MRRVFHAILRRLRRRDEAQLSTCSGEGHDEETPTLPPPERRNAWGNTPWGERSVTIPVEQFLGLSPEPMKRGEGLAPDLLTRRQTEGVTPEQLLPLANHPQEAALKLLEVRERANEVQHFVKHMGQYDLVGWACELVGFERRDIAAVQCWYDLLCDYIVLEVALMDEWVPEYTIEVDGLIEGREPMPHRLER